MRILVLGCVDLKRTWSTVVRVFSLFLCPRAHQPHTNAKRIILWRVIIFFRLSVSLRLLCLCECVLKHQLIKLLKRHLCNNGVYSILHQKKGWVQTYTVHYNGLLLFHHHHHNPQPNVYHFLRIKWKNTKFSTKQTEWGEKNNKSTSLVFQVPKW